MPLKTGELCSVNGGMVRICGAPDYGVTRRDFVSGLNVVSPLDTEFFHLRVQCGSFQTEAFRGTVGATDHSLALAEDAKDVVAFRGIQVRVRRSGEFFDGFEFGEGRAQNRTLRENDRPLHEILELADVARPAPFDERLQGLGGNRFDASAHTLGMAAEEIAN